MALPLQNVNRLYVNPFVKDQVFFPSLWKVLRRNRIVVRGYPIRTFLPEQTLVNNNLGFNHIIISLIFSAFAAIHAYCFQLRCSLTSYSSSSPDLTPVIAYAHY